jgi:hypothetical protein
MGKNQTQRAPAHAWGANSFALYVDDLGINNCAGILGVSARTIVRWTRGDPPRMACMALYWESKYGRGQLTAEADYLHALVVAQLHESQDEARRLGAALEALLAEKAHGDCAANDGYFLAGTSAAMRHAAESRGR